MRTISALTLFLVATAANAQADVSPDVAGPAPFELKGVSLGGSVEDVHAIAPAAVCEEKKPGLTLCIDKTATLGGFPAELWLNYLDGVLINIDYRHLRFQDAMAIEAGLIQKFGRPEPRYRNGQLKNDGGYRTHVLSFWIRGDQNLVRDPLDWKDSRTQDVYSNISLMDAKRWNEEWVPRLKARSVPDSVKADL